MFRAQGWRLPPLLFVGLSILLLSACGGGGSSHSESDRFGVYTIDVVANSSGGHVVPEGPQRLASSGSIKFSLVPDPGKKVVLNGTCPDVNLHLAANQLFISNPRGDCTLPVTFEADTFTVNAAVGAGELYPIDPASIGTDHRPDFLALDSNHDQAYAVTVDGDSSTIDIYGIDSDGGLTSPAAQSILVPHISTGCGETASGAALSSRCLIVGPADSKAADHVYAIVDKTCDSSGCVDTPTIRIFGVDSNNLTEEEDVDLAAGFAGVSIEQVSSIAINPVDNLLVLTGVVKQEDEAPRHAVVFYSIESDGILISHSLQFAPNAFEDAILGDVVVDPIHDGGAYVILKSATSDENDSNVGILIHHVSSGAGGEVEVKSLLFNNEDIDVQGLIIDDGRAYLLLSGRSSSKDAEVHRYTIGSEGELTQERLQVFSFDDGQYPALHLNPTNETGYLLVKGKGTNERTGIYRVEVEDDGALRIVDKTENIDGDGAYNLALDADNERAYLAIPELDTINQYQLSTTNGTITPETQQVEGGETVTLAVTPDDGYKGFARDSDCGGSFSEANSEYTIANIVTNCHVVAGFVPE